MAALFARLEAEEGKKEAEEGKKEAVERKGEKKTGMKSQSKQPACRENT